jgi:phospholipase/carboxylesterase
MMTSSALCVSNDRVPMPEKSLVIFLHGIGASGAQLMPLASSWRSRLPTARFVAPDAPMHHRYGHQWFSTEGNPLDPARILAARDAFDAVIGDVVRREGFDDAYDRVALVGVSQGAIVALDAVASGRWQVGALVSFAGLLPPHPVSPVSKDTAILLVHGQNDMTIPPMASDLAAAQFRAAGFKVELEMEAGVGHTISPSGANKALTFLKDVLA